MEIYKFSEFEVSKCVGNSPKFVRKHYMNQMQADHRKEAEAQKVEDEQRQMEDNRPAPQRSAACRTDTVTMPIEDYERVIKERETLRNQRLNVLRDAVEYRSVPLQSKSAKTKKVHPTGFEPVTSCSVDRCSIQLS